MKKLPSSQSPARRLAAPTLAAAAGGLITEFGMPALDGSSKDAAKLGMPALDVLSKDAA